MIRAKMYVQAKTQYGTQHGANAGGTVKLNPVYGDTPENKAFFNSTPSGLIELSVSQQALDMFELGRVYYVDFTMEESEPKEYDHE
jgi:hypothetical protein